MNNKEKTNEDIVKEFQTQNDKGDKTKALQCFAELIARNSRLVSSVVNKIQCSDAIKDDLMQECMVAIWKAALTYDESFNVKFFHYTYKIVRIRVWNCYVRERSLIKVSSTMKGKMLQYVRGENKLLQQYNAKDITPEMIAECSGLSLNEVEQCQQIPGVVFESGADYNNKTGAESSFLLDNIVDKNAARIYDEFLSREAIKTDMHRFLTARETEIATLLAGINDEGRVYTPSEVATKLHISDEAVRQARVRASLKLPKN